MLLSGNNIFTLRYSDGTSQIVAGDYTEVREYATSVVDIYQVTVNIYCHGTASIWSTITPEGVASVAAAAA